MKILVIWDVTPCIMVYDTNILLPSSGWQKQCNIFVKDIIVLGKDEKGNGTGKPVVIVGGVVGPRVQNAWKLKSDNRRFLGYVGDERL